jgi:DNA-binding ferritin-like protein (Dps family)
MEKYYYCTTKTYFKTTQVLKSIIEIFEESGKTELEFNNVYNLLRDKLFVGSVNRKHLQNLLGTKDNVALNDVKGLYDESLSFDQEGDVDADEPVEEDYVITKHNKVKKAVVFKHIIAIFDEAQADQLKFNEIKEALATKLNCSNVNVDSLKTLLKISKPYVLKQEVVALESSFLDNLKRKAEEMENKRLSNVKTIIKQMHMDNKNIPIECVAGASLVRELHDLGINTAGELALLSDERLLHLINTKERALADLLKLLPESYRVRVDSNFYRYVICGVNRKSGKKPTECSKHIDIMSRRVGGATLQEAGGVYGLTRERARQIESAFIDRFDDFISRLPGGLINLLRTCATNKNYVSKMEVSSIIHQCVDVFWYLLKESDERRIVYMEELDMFALIDELNWYEEVVNSITDLPGVLSVFDLDAKINELHGVFIDLGLQIEKAKIANLIKQSYQKQGTMYSKHKITKQEKYLQVLKKHYPDGLKIYDDEQLNKFRKHYISMFDRDDLHTKNRAICRAISIVASVKDRGTYVVANNKNIISEELLSNICQYIEKSEKSIFMINTLYYVFKEKLEKEGISNRYQLQWVLRKKVGHKYHLSRDYISKDRDVTSVYHTITSFIKDANRMITKQELQNEFPGVPDNVFAFALADENIIVGLGAYAHKSYVEKFKVSLQSILHEMNKIVSDGEIHNCQELFETLKKELPAIIEEINITDRYFLFSILEEFWADKFEFRRPFFAKVGVPIAKQDERIKEFVAVNAETDMSDLRGYINENSFVVNSLLELVDNLNDVVIYKNKDTLVRIDDTGLNDEIQEEIDSFLDAQIGKNKLPSEIKDFCKLPDIGIEWNDWLLYSVVKKWSKKYTAITTHNMYKMAEPRFEKA